MKTELELDMIGGGRANGEPRGNEVYYLPQGKEVELFEAAYSAKLPIMLKGPTGCGKTRFVERMAWQLGLPLITVSCNEDTSASDLLGRHLIVGGETRWVDGPVTRAARSGGLLYLDEIAEARSDALVVIHSLSDHRREIFLDRTGETVRAPADFALIASFNPGYQQSLREMKPSTRQRMVSLSFGYPNAKAEAEIVAKESGLDGKNCQKLVALAQKLRAATEVTALESASTRLLVATAQLMRQGIAPRLAAYAGIAESLSDDVDSLAAIKQLIDLSL